MSIFIHNSSRYQDVLIRLVLFIGQGLQVLPLCTCCNHSQVIFDVTQDKNVAGTDKPKALKCDCIYNIDILF